MGAQCRRTLSDFWLSIDFPECSSRLSQKGEHQAAKYGQKTPSKGREPQAQNPEDPQRVLGTAGSSSWLVGVVGIGGKRWAG